MTTGQQLAAARRQAGIPRAALAAKSGLTDRALAAVEADRVALRRTVAMRLAAALGVSVPQLLGWNRAALGGSLFCLPVLGVIRAGLPTFAGEGCGAMPLRQAAGKFFLRAETDWPQEGVFSGMQLLFDANAEPVSGDLVACAIGLGQPALYRWQTAGPGVVQLFSANGQSETLCCREFETGWAELFGVAQDRVQPL